MTTPNTTARARIIVGAGGHEAVDLPEQTGRGERSEQAAHSSHDDDQEAIDDQRRAHVGEHGLEARHHDPGDAGEAGPVGEGQRVHPLDVDATGGGHLRVAHDRAHLHPDRQAIHDEPGERGEQQADHDDEAAVDVDVGSECRHGAGQPIRDAHILQAGAEPFDVLAEERCPEFEAHGLLQQDRHTPRGEQRVEQPPVQMADDEFLDRQADQRGDDKGERDGEKEPDMQPDAAHDRRVGADHHEVTVRHVDDAHRPVGDGQPERDQEQDGAEAEADEDDVDHRFARGGGGAGLVSS